MEAVLVLNADLGPLQRVSLKHAIRMLWRQVAEVHDAQSRRLEDKDRSIGIRLRDPPAERAAPQPLVLEVPEPLQVVETVHFPHRIPARLFRPVEPERAPRLRRKVPAHDLAHLGIQLLRRLPGGFRDRRIGIDWHRCTRMRDA